METTTLMVDEEKVLAGLIANRSQDVEATFSHGESMAIVDVTAQSAVKDNNWTFNSDVKQLPSQHLNLIL